MPWVAERFADGRATERERRVASQAARDAYAGLCAVYGRDQRPEVAIPSLAARVARDAIDTRRSTCGLIARTEALVAGLGLAEALKRASAYVDNGADAVFVQSLDATGKEILDFCQQWECRTPIVLAPTRLPTLSNQDLYAAGATHVIFANQGLRAAHHAMARVFKLLAESGSAVDVNPTISRVATVASDVGADRLKELDERLAAASKS